MATITKESIAQNATNYWHEKVQKKEKQIAMESALGGVGGVAWRQARIGKRAKLHNLCNKTKSERETKTENGKTKQCNAMKSKRNNNNNTRNNNRET